MDFVREQGVVGLAIGLAIGTAAGSSVKAIVDGFINPIVGFILGGTNLNGSKWVIVRKSASSSRELIIGWGPILSSLITLLATAAVIYYIVHGLKLDKLDKKKEK